MVMANEIVEPDVTWKGISLEWVVRIVLTMTISPCGTRANFALHTHVSNKRVSRRPAGALVQGPGISSWQTRRLNSLKKVKHCWQEKRVVWVFPSYLQTVSNN